MMGSALTRAKRPMTVEAFRDRPAVSSHSSCALSHSSCAINPIVPELSCTSPLGACEKCLLYQAQRVDRRRNSGTFCRVAQELWDNPLTIYGIGPSFTPGIGAPTLGSYNCRRRALSLAERRQAPGPLPRDIARSAHGRHEPRQAPSGTGSDHHSAPRTALAPRAVRRHVHCAMRHVRCASNVTLTASSTSNSPRGQRGTSPHTQNSVREPSSRPPG